MSFLLMNLINTVYICSRNDLRLMEIKNNILVCLLVSQLDHLQTENKL